MGNIWYCEIISVPLGWDGGVCLYPKSTTYQHPVDKLSYGVDKITQLSTL